MEEQTSSILIVGSGLFGLSTAWALARRPSFRSALITVVDQSGGQFPPPDAASVDSSRIIRADYADPDYTELATTAQAEWRKQGDDELGGQGRYSESGLVLTADAPTDDKFGPMGYAKKSWENVVAYAAAKGYPASRVRTLETSKAVKDHLGIRGHAGDWGYANTFSGWADAGKGMEWLLERVKATERVRFVDAKVVRLETEGNRVVGARLSHGDVLRADLVIVAAGAWTGELIDLRGQVEATGQVLGYVDISDAELAELAKQPVVLHMTSGLFVIPPREKVLKVARHSYGYQNPQTVADALPPSPADERKCAEGPDAGRGPAHATLEGDEDLLGLFVATGDSGHAYKFLPVLGDKVVDCMSGNGGKLGRKWRWKAAGGEPGRLVTKDGSRGGASGILAEELEKTRSEIRAKLA
ncbi:hypothetical protein HIM_07418 [Hirsutella minnesotensis 3608]|uniref:FAD dependent oxidoreductase domain-containing protein n=1 Tax=Hirsutella minnesotensis 3608 TaxID=1043627 RepID=A0A0F7ZHX5_9HYPO|nr:hypothetical protein HIM_07418 [Hirsutella minnesotensis 3608]